MAAHGHEVGGVCLQHGAHPYHELPTPTVASLHLINQLHVEGREWRDKGMRKGRRGREGRGKDEGEERRVWEGEGEGGSLKNCHLVTMGLTREKRSHYDLHI